MRGQTRAQNFNIAYSVLHKISFRMSGRSLCDVWFSQTLRHKFDLYIYLPNTAQYQYISEFWRKFHEMQILRVHISACENAFDLKFWR